MLHEIGKFFGSLAFIFMLLAMSRFLLTWSLVKKYDKNGYIKKLTPYIVKYHGNCGKVSLILALAHFIFMWGGVVEMKPFILAGIATLITLVVIGLTGALGSKVNVKYKKIFFQLHMKLPLIALIFFILHKVL